MNYKNRFLEITDLEENIVNNNYSPVKLGESLKKLKKLRTELYNSVYQNQDVINELNDELVLEHRQFCIFNFKLLATKRLSNAVFIEVLKAFLKDCTFADGLKDERTKVKTLKTLINIKQYLEEANLKAYNYRLRELGLFMDDYKNKNNSIEIKSN